jgi:hypothetical protein
MTEAQWSEVEKVLLYISDARKRAQRAAGQLDCDNAPEHVKAAVSAAESDLAQLHRQLMQSTYFAVEDDSLKLAI